MRLAAVNDTELATAAHWQSARQLDLDSQCFQSRVLHATKVMEKEQERKEVIVLAVPNEAIESRLCTLDSIGLNVRAVDATPCAIHHALQFLFPAAFESPVIVIVPGESTLTLSIVSDGQIQFLRSLDIGIAELLAIPSESITQAPSDPLDKAELLLAESGGMTNGSSDTTGAQASDSSDSLTDLSREVNKSIHHFAVTFNSRKPQDGLILGGHEGSQGLANALSHVTSIPFEKVPSAIWSNVHGFEERDTSGDPISWATALGLTMYESGDIKERGAA